MRSTITRRHDAGRGFQPDETRGSLCIAHPSVVSCICMAAESARSHEELPHTRSPPKGHIPLEEPQLRTLRSNSTTMKGTRVGFPKEVDLHIHCTSKHRNCRSVPSKPSSAHVNVLTAQPLCKCRLKRQYGSQ